MPHLHEADQAVSIVIADNDPELIRLTIDRLHRGYGPISVSGFSDSRQAAALVVRTRPSLLICSPQLPRVGGMDLITLAQKRWGQLPAIVLVDSAGLGPSGYLRASSTVTYLEKPFTPEALQYCITALIGLLPQPAPPPIKEESVEISVTLEPAPAAATEATEQPAQQATEQAAAEAPAEAPADEAEPQLLAANDAEVSDVEVSDAEVSDAEVSDAEVSDVETSDVEVSDVAASDAAVSDVAASDAAVSDVEASDAGAGDAATSDAGHETAEPEAVSESQPEEAQLYTAAFQSAETSRLMAHEEDLYVGDLSLSSVTPLPISRPPSQEISDIWLQQAIAAHEPIESSAPPQDALALHNEGISQKGERAMALTATSIKENLTKLESIDGFVGAALADSDNGMCLGFIGGGGIFNLEIAAAANTEVVRSKRKAIKTLSLRDEIEDILITLGKQYHLIRPVRSRPSLFYYLALDRQRANLAMARYTLAEVERDLPM